MCEVVVVVWESTRLVDFRSTKKVRRDPSATALGDVPTVSRRIS